MVGGQFDQFEQGQHPKSPLAIYVAAVKHLEPQTKLETLDAALNVSCAKRYFVAPDKDATS